MELEQRHIIKFWHLKGLRLHKVARELSNTGRQYAVAPSHPRDLQIQPLIALRPLMSASFIIRRPNGRFFLVTEIDAIFRCRCIRLAFDHFSWSSIRDFSFTFSAGTTPARQISKLALRHSLGTPLIVCEVSNAGASMFNKGASFWIMNLGRGDRQLILLTFKSCLASRKNSFAQPTHLLTA
jgi:hypothetical protein